MKNKILGSIVFWSVLVAIIFVAVPGEIITPLIAVSPLIAVIASIAFYFVYLLPSNRSYVLFALFIVGLLATGYFAGSYGKERGIEFFCNDGGGNLCGLGGHFVTGPLAFSVTAIVYTFFWFVCMIAFRALKLSP